MDGDLETLDFLRELEARGDLVTRLISPFWITPMINAPITVPKTVPAPPNSDAPPITTAAIESNSNGSPALAAPLVKRVEYNTPAIAANNADSR